MSDEAIDLEDKLFIFRVYCHAHDEWEISKCFHIVTEEGYDEGFYCPICDAEGKRIRSTYIQDEHSISLLGKLTFQDLLQSLTSKARNQE